MKRWLRIALIGIVMSALQLVFDLFLPNPSFQGILPPSPLLESGNYPILAFLVGWLVFTLMTAGYELIDLRLPGTKRYKTWVYLACELVVFILYLCEPLPHRLPVDYFLNSLKAVLVFMVQGALIEKLLATKRQHYQRKPFIYNRALLVYTLSMVIFRFFAYRGLDIYSLGDDNLTISLGWAAMLGLTMGGVFCVLQRYLRRQDKKGKNYQFTWGFFAPAVLAYHAFFALRYEIALVDVVSRAGVDIMAVFLATWIVLHWQIDELAGVKQNPTVSGEI
ncbi:hypothetical protein QP168_06630 [Aerococcus urinae]|uniref:Ferric oxidoreductase domain-containing protein n=1 Tax=Aerococcus mictus TaxID=2976810 RepID=A0A1E9PS08_9LACT|nr:MULTISPECIES: hypothetical protein [Aerococcus]KAA9293141.1 hypothetical protein F6I06_01580 [Aerococcus mictus]MBU5609716.1 hypothetical protein [Aerococcus urinae]MCY3034632.1 hypothetical protein [Aerococcus mictus]MCY3063586.1 hypothetical protein [Aerococcus mictus]MCY3065948.1 hypothetical protein [Aerococcus mictus]